MPKLRAKNDDKVLDCISASMASFHLKVCRNVVETVSFKTTENLDSRVHRSTRICECLCMGQTGRIQYMNGEDEEWRR